MERREDGTETMTTTEGGREERGEEVVAERRSMDGSSNDEDQSKL